MKNQNENTLKERNYNHYLSLEERKQIEELLNQGKQPQEIAYILKRSEYAIRSDIKRCLSLPAYSAEYAQQDHINKRCRKFQKRKTYDLQTRQKLRELITSGKSNSHIAEILGLSRNAINRELSLNGGRGLYDPEEAENRSILAKGETYNIASMNATLRHNKVFDKIDSLQMQIDILADQIKELMNKN